VNRLLLVAIGHQAVQNFEGVDRQVQLPRPLSLASLLRQSVFQAYLSSVKGQMGVAAGAVHATHSYLETTGGIIPYRMHQPAGATEHASRMADCGHDTLTNNASPKTQTLTCYAWQRLLFPYINGAF
jgi:hypothetical protein